MENEEFIEEITPQIIEETTPEPIKKVIRHRRKKGEPAPKKKKKKRGPGRPRKVKLGRPKKRGPKRKRRSTKKVTPKPRVYVSRKKKFKLFSCYNGKQSKKYGSFDTSAEVREKIAELMEDQKNIVFPKLYENTRKGIARPRYEYIILERNTDGTKNPLVLLDEFGNERVQKTNLSEWVIIDKVPFLTEETFWVFGKNPKTDRKTFSWIFDNIVMKEIAGETSLRRIYLFKNKILFKDDNGEMELVICKIEADAIRFYNLLCEKLRGNKRFMIMKGKHNTGEKRNMVVRDIVKLTGWDESKICMKTSRKCNTEMPL